MQSAEGNCSAIPSPAGAKATAGLCWWQRLLSKAHVQKIAKLCNTQMKVHSQAAQHENGPAVVPDRMGAAAIRL